jgi:hypothetical protein
MSLPCGSCWPTRRHDLVHEGAHRCALELTRFGGHLNTWASCPEWKKVYRAARVPRRGRRSGSVKAGARSLGWCPGPM